MPGFGSLQVLPQGTDCVLKINQILDSNICSTIHVTTGKPRKVEDKDTYILITPTGKPNDDNLNQESNDDNGSQPRSSNSGQNGGQNGNNGRNSGGNGGDKCHEKTCYEPSEKVCDKSTVAFDFDLLVILGLLTKEELERYLKIRGLLPQECKLDINKDKVKLESLLSVGVLTEDKMLEAKVGNGLIDLGLGGKGGLLKLDIGGKDGLLNIHLKRNDSLLDAEVLSETNSSIGLPNIDLNVISHPVRRPHRNTNPQRLLDIDLLGEADKPGNEAQIDIDVGTTRPHRHHRRDGGLVDVDVGGYKDENPAAIDIDVLTKSRPEKDVQSEKPALGGGDHFVHYQPICKKTFKNCDQAEKVHAQDANHCLALCNARAADFTLSADIKAGDLAHIQSCAAIVFDSTQNNSNNCRYLVRPEARRIGLW